MGRFLSLTLILSVCLTALPGQPAAAATAALHAAPAPAATTTALHAAPAPAAAPPTTGASGPRLLVRFRDAATLADRDAALNAVSGVVVGSLPELGVIRVALDSALPDAPDVPAVLRLLRGYAAVEWVEADQAVSLALAPNDTFFNTDPFTGLGQWGVKKIQADRAWDLQRGLPSVIVAVIDTGIDPTHPDLATAVLPGATFVSRPSAGCAISDRDDNTHGTHVAGIIAAAGNNGAGIAGVAFGVRLLPVKALDCTGTGTTGDIAQAILYAVNQGARVINVSLGSPSDSSTIRSAVSAATSRNVLIVAAAGNCGLGGGTCDVTNETSYPAAYPEVLAVAATDVDDTKAPFSTAASYVGISAPGRRIVSTAPTYSSYASQRGGTQSYAVISGTSQATPFVAGTAALLLSKDPTLTPAQLTARLKGTADHLGTSGTNAQFGAGRVNAFAAIGASGTAAPVTTPPVTYGAAYDLAQTLRSLPFGVSTPVTVRATNTSSFTWTAAGVNPVRLSYHWLDPVGAPVTFEGVRTPLQADVAPAATVTQTMNVLAPSAPGVYQLRVDLVREGSGGGWFSERGAPASSIFITVNSGFGATYVVGPAVSANLALNVPVTVPLTLTNTGTRTWSFSGATPVNASYHWLSADGSVAVWEGVRTRLTADVLTNGTATVSLAVLPPPAVGRHTLRIDLVQEGVTWFSGQGVATRDLSYNVTTGLNAAWTVSAQPAAVLPGGRASVAITVRNEGIAPWAAGGSTPVRLAAHVSDGAGNTVLWDGPRTLLTADVAPGGTFTGTVAVPAPLAAGTYRVRVDLVQEGVTWFSTQGAPVAELQLQVVADFRASLQWTQTTVSRAAPTVQVSLTNTSALAWTGDGAVPINVSVHWYDASGAVLVWDGPRTKLAAPLASGQSVTLAVNTGPPPAGAALLAIDVVADGLRWFGGGTPRPVTLVP